MSEKSKKEVEKAKQNDGGMAGGENEGEKLKRAFLKATEQFYEAVKKEYRGPKDVFTEVGIDII